MRFSWVAGMKMPPCVGVSSYPTLRRDVHESAVNVVSAGERRKLSQGVSHALAGMRVIQVFSQSWQEPDRLQPRAR